MNQSKVSVVVIVDGDQALLDRFLGSLVSFGGTGVGEVLVVDNGFALSQEQNNRKEFPIRIVASKEKQKPQAGVAQALEMATNDTIVFHTSRDEVLEGYDQALTTGAKAVDATHIAVLPTTYVGPSQLFAKKPLLSGHLFSRAALLSGTIQYDEMFRLFDEKTYAVVRVPGGPVVRYHDVPQAQTTGANPVSVIVTIKNRLAHWERSMPTLVAQRGVPYELIFVDYYSEDAFAERLTEHIQKYKDSYSPQLLRIVHVRLKENKKFSSCKAKNLGVRHAEFDTLVFSDIDTLLREDYLSHWIPAFRALQNALLVTRAGRDLRLSTEVNYGNMVVAKKDYETVKGHNESIRGWGGDEDEFIHRLANAGVREHNPDTAADARQYSILHGDEERLAHLESTELSGLQNLSFLEDPRITWTDSDAWGEQEVDRHVYDFET